jgi:teichoic acid transport system permease protein
MLPVTSTLTQLLYFLSATVVMLVVVVATGEPARLSWLAIPAVLALQLMLNLGLAMMAARAANHVPDIQQILPFIFRFLLYASGVIFLVDEYVERSSFRLLFELNPFYGVVAIWRWAVLEYSISARLAVYTAIVSLVCLFGGFWWFRRGEREYTLGS